MSAFKNEPSPSRGPCYVDRAGPYKTRAPFSCSPDHVYLFSSASISLAQQFVLHATSLCSSVVHLLRNRIHGASGLSIGFRLLGVPPPVNAGRRGRRRRAVATATAAAEEARRGRRRRQRSQAPVPRGAEAAEDEALHPPTVRLHAAVLERQRSRHVRLSSDQGPVVLSSRPRVSEARFVTDTNGVWQNNVLTRYPRAQDYADHFRMALDCFFTVWFVVGNVCGYLVDIFLSHDAPNLYRLCIAFLTFSCIGYACLSFSAN